MLNMAFLFLLVVVLLGLSPICIEKRCLCPLLAASKVQVCGACTESTEEGQVQTGSSPPAWGLRVCRGDVVQRRAWEKRASQISNKWKVGLQHNRFTWMPFIYDSPFTLSWKLVIFNRGTGWCTTMCLWGIRALSVFLLRGQAAVSC